MARLHSGDVSFYSAMGEQRRALKALNIACHIIPGVPAFAAAAAALGQELTVPRLNQSLVLTRGAGNATPMPETESLAALGAAGATVIIHLFAQKAEQIQRGLLPLYGADCPIAIAANALPARGFSGGGQMRQLRHVLGIGYNSRAENTFAARVLLQAIKMPAKHLQIDGFAAVCAPGKTELPAFLPQIAGILPAELLLFDGAALKMQAEYCLSFSARAQALYGCGSVAEAAALCGAKQRGREARLIMPKVSCGAFSFAFVAFS